MSQPQNVTGYRPPEPYGPPPHTPDLLARGRITPDMPFDPPPTAGVGNAAKTIGIVGAIGSLILMFILVGQLESMWVILIGLIVAAVFVAVAVHGFRARANVIRRWLDQLPAQR